MHSRDRFAGDSEALLVAQRREPFRVIRPVKVAFESRRFWEEEGIYSGVGWTDALSENVLYPSVGWHSDKGVLVAAAPR